MREMAKNGGFADGGLMPFKEALDKALAELHKQDQSIALRRLLDTDEATIRYQEVILGIERRWDAVMKRRNTNN